MNDLDRPGDDARDAEGLANTPDAIPQHTTPTWEMELLVSGATIFGLLQLPALLDHAYFRAVNLLPDEYADMMLPLWVYAKVGVVTLAATFVLHLLLRGYWVALVGMNSVFPGGIRWSELGIGPLVRERLARSAPTLPTVIERADNRATRVFGVGFGVAMMMIVPVVLVLASLVVGAVVDSVLGEGHLVPVIVAVFVVFLGPIVVASQLDRRVGARLPADSRLARAIAAVQAKYAGLGVGTRSNPLIGLFASNIGRRKFGAVMFPLAVLLSLTFTLQAMGAKGRSPLGLLHGLPAGTPFSASASPASFYGDARGDGWAVLPMPYIPSRVVQGPYLELFVPYISRLHGTALAKTCPGASADARDEAQAATRLACLARLLDIRVDGAASDVPLMASTDPSTGQPGVVAMLPVAALAPGRHELSLDEPDRRDVGGKPARRYRIAFWK